MFVQLTTDQKGNVAEAAVALASLERGIDVYRPVGEGGRYDLVLDLPTGLARVQCKWARREGDVIVIRCYSARRTADGQRCRPYPGV